MSSNYTHIRPDTYIFIRLPNETLKPIEIKLNSTIAVGKLGSLSSNLLIGRPFYHTYELLDDAAATAAAAEKQHDSQLGNANKSLRIVTPAELNLEAGLDNATPNETRADPDGPPAVTGALPEGFDLLADNGSNGIIKDNRLTVDDASRQALSQAEIEELKKSADGKAIIEKILANHAGLDEKTVFSKAKYMLRKHKKYLKRFTVLPMDLGYLIEHIMEKEPPRIMEMREECLGLVGAWSNAHYQGLDGLDTLVRDTLRTSGMWLTVDETGGLVVAALAERMGILHLPLDDATAKTTTKPAEVSSHSAEANTGSAITETASMGQARTNGAASTVKRHRDFPIPASNNTITVIHPAVQPNLSLLKYFGYDLSSPDLGTKELEHPLHTSLKCVSWLQLLDPTSDPTYIEPESVREETLASWKSGKRGTYYKKRRRWERCRAIVDETRQGGFEGLVVASHMDPIDVLQHCLHLVRAGGHVVIYSPTVEPLLELTDLYSKDRRTAYIAYLSRNEVPDAEDFPLDPRLLLAPSIQTSRVCEWQILPGRTHPLMTARGGAEGYVLSARKVVPLDGHVEARGIFSGKKRKVVDGSAQPIGTPEVESDL